MPEAGARRRSRRASPEVPPPPKRWAPWVLPLVAGLSFGAGYGLTDRLLGLAQGGAVKLDQSFDVKPFPGTSLESLRLRFGADRKDLRGTPDLIEKQPGQQKSNQQERSQPDSTKPNASANPDGSQPRQEQAESEPAPEPSASTPEPQRSESAGEPAPSVEPPPPPSPDPQP